MVPKWFLSMGALVILREKSLKNKPCREQEAHLFRQAVQSGLRRLPDGFDDLRRFDRHGLALLRQDPRHDDFCRDFRNRKQKRTVAVLLHLLPGVHLVGIGELHRVTGQADLHVADLFVAHDVVERDGIDDPAVRLERLLEQPCVFDAVDDERAGGFPQVTVRLDAPFVEIKEQHMRIDVAFHLAAVLIVVDDVQTPVGLPGFEHHGKDAGILGDSARCKHLQRTDERLFQKLRAVRLQDLVHSSGNASAHGIGKHVLRDAPADDEREHGRLRKIRRAVEVPAAVLEVIGVRPAVEPDRAAEFVFERFDIAVHRPQAVLPAQEIPFVDAQCLVFLEDAFRRRAAVPLQKGGDSGDADDLDVPRHRRPAAFSRFPAFFHDLFVFSRGVFFHHFFGSWS